MNVFFGLLVGFTLGAVVACLGSNFLTRYEAFKAETVDKLKAERKDILALEERARANELQQMELNARYDKRLHQEFPEGSHCLDEGTLTGCVG